MSCLLGRFAAAAIVVPTVLSTQARQPIFIDVASKSNVSMTVRSGDEGKFHLMDTMTGGVCLIDIDDDGLLDVFFVNGSTLKAFLVKLPAHGNRLYRNLGGGKFEDVTTGAGVGGHSGWGMGCAAADFDNDGRTDLYVTNLGRSILYRNTGRGKFMDVSKASGTGHGGWSTGAAWGDFDNDGWLDLFVSRYVDFDFANPPKPGAGETCKYLGIPVACGPKGLTGAQGVFYRNNHDGTFSDETKKRGLIAPLRYGLGVCASDYDNDGDLDLFVANDSTGNFLFRNRGRGQFDEVAVASGVAYNEDGNTQACMGTDFGDYDNDGNLDLIVTNFARDTNTLYRNERNGFFSDATTRAGHRDSYPYMGWGVGFVDFDNDGWKDLYVVNGHLYPQIDSVKTEIGYRQSDLLYSNLGGGRFANISNRLIHAKHVGRGAAFGDLDNDGRVDVVISNIDSQVNVLMNRSETRNNWLTVRCQGTRGNRNAIGARITITTGQGEQIGEVRSGCSYLSSSDPRVHFGLGSVATVAKLSVTWPGGTELVLKDVRANQILTLVESSQ